MAKKFILVLLTLMCVFTLVSCLGCDHEWNEATCDTPRTCSLCGETDGNAKGHSFGEWTETTAATCTTSGSKTRSCACGKTETEVIPAGHDLVEHQAKAATCTEVGYNAYVACKNCDYTTYVEIPKTEHDIENHSAEPSTCTKAGHNAYQSCKNCSYSTYEALPLEEHDTVSHHGEPATCTKTGYKPYKTCNNCDYTTYEEIPMEEHDKVYHPANPATCAKTGYKAYETCKNCSYTTYEEIPMKDHDTVSHQGKPATCTEVGYKPYETCKNCTYTTYEEIPMEKHDTIEHEAEKSTCIKAGHNAYVTCKNCTYSTYEPLPLGDHEYDTIVTPPTCEGKGYTTYQCKTCPHSYVDNEVDPTGHSWGSWFVSKPITKDSDGEMCSNCLNCSKHQTRAPEVVRTGIFGFGNNNTYGNNATYTIYEDGTLKVVGTGQIFDAGWNGASQPYKDIRSFITRVVISEGITTMKGGTFAYLNNLEYVELPTTLKHFGNNIFMDSFKSSITSYTFPEHITNIDYCAIGQYNSNNALFTDVYILNPNVTINDSEKYRPFNGDRDNSKLTLYSYGKANSVSIFAAIYGYKYVDLNDMLIGTVDNLKYTYSNGVLTLEAVDNSKPAVLPTEKPWAEKIAEITTLNVGSGITDIPANYFADYTALTSVTLADTVLTIGSKAFSTSSACNTAMTINIPEKVTSLASDVLSGRTNVTVTGFRGTAAENIKQDGVTLKLKTKFKLLLLGNSLSLDAADATGANTTSKLYEILKSMLGEDTYVQIGVLYQGAKTAGWHATVAERDTASYQFYVISDDTNGLWQIKPGYSSREGLLYSDWDIVTIQPYATETTTGVGSMTGDTDAKQQNPTVNDPNKDEKFKALEDSLPFLLDHIAKYCPDAKVYYYLTWANTQNTDVLNHNTPGYNTMLNVAVNAMQYVGTESGKGFEALLPVGTAIQNARSTYFAFLRLEQNPNKDNQIGLLRDNVHLSYRVGRYIAALSFAELLVPESYRVDGYVLPDVADSPIVGKLPKQYTEIARKCVQNMLETYNLTGEGRYGVKKLVGYEVDPTTAFKAEVEAMNLGTVTAANANALLTAVQNKILAEAPTDMSVTVTSDSTITLTSTPQNVTVTVTLKYGYATVTLTKTISASLS